MNSSRRLINQQSRISIIQIIGACMIALGIVILLSIAIYELKYTKKEQETDISSLIAIGFFIIMLGMAFFFPDMLKADPKSTISTMRVAIYMIISVFIFMVVKLGWNCNSLKDFDVSSTWAAILIAALGGKAVQSLGENLLNKTMQNNSSIIGSSPNNYPNSTQFSSQDIPLYDSSKINIAPPSDPPPHIKL